MTTITTDELLAQIAQEREKYAESDNDKMADLCEQLTEAGIYPATPFMEEMEYTALDMVTSWGADWHIFREPLKCGGCGKDLRNLNTGPPFKLEIGIEHDRDRVEYFKCPSCEQKL